MGTVQVCLKYLFMVKIVLLRKFLITNQILKSIKKDFFFLNFPSCTNKTTKNYLIYHMLNDEMLILFNILCWYSRTPLNRLSLGQSLGHKIIWPDKPTLVKTEIQTQINVAKHMHSI